jgi:hypothetical protein
MNQAPKFIKFKNNQFPKGTTSLICNFDKNVLSCEPEKIVSRGYSHHRSYDDHDSSSDEESSCLMCPEGLPGKNSPPGVQGPPGLSGP